MPYLTDDIINGVKGVTSLAQGIGDFGAMAILASSFILLSLLMWGAIFRWFRGIINQMLENNSKNMSELLSETRKQNEMLCDVSEGLRNETQLRLRNLSGFAFDLSVEAVCRLIHRIREENNISDRVATTQKIRNLLNNLHEDRKSRFDPFTYRGKSLSQYCNDEWVEKVAAVVEGEIYNENGPNDKRAFTNIKMAYDDIKLDFYHRLNS